MGTAKNRNYLIDILKRFEGYGHNLKIIKKDNGFFALVADTGEDKTKAMTLLKRYKRDFDDAFLEKKKDADVSLNLSSLIKNTPKKGNVITLIDKMQKEKLKLSLEDYLQLSRCGKITPLFIPFDRLQR